MSYLEYPVIAEGKTKIIRSVPGSQEVTITSKDDITAGDGAKKDILVGKGALATETTSSCFRLLNRMGIRTHFTRKVDERTFLARHADMIPIEVVARRVATGSFLQRNPEISEGVLFDPPVLEFFSKDDGNHDPLIIYDFVGKRVLRFNAHKPLKEGFIEEKPLEDPAAWSTLLGLTQTASRVFAVLEAAWARQDVTLVDLKIECGFAKDTGRLMVADVIDNDSWRIWPRGDKTLMLDKQVYRNLKTSTPESLDSILDNYRRVAQATRKFRYMTI